MKKFLAVVLCATAMFSPQVYAKVPEGESVKPLLLIRYNQEHVYYTRALKQAVANAENTKASVKYKVVSVVPTGNRKGTVKIGAERAKSNLASVLTSIQQLGVPADRISSSTESSALALSQEIKIYVE